MKQETANPFDLQPNPWNPNSVSREDFEKLKRSISELGNFKPIVVRECEGVLQIIGGFHRCEAAKELGLPQVPIFNLGSISDQKAKEISLVDNVRYGKDDSELLASLIDDMDTDLIELVLPETEDVDLPEIDSGVDDILNEKGKVEEDDSTRTLKFKYYDLDKADEVEDKLLLIAKENNYYFADGYANLSEALYHALIIDGKL